MMNTTEYFLSSTSTSISQSDKRKFSEQQQQHDVVFSTPTFSRRDDDDVDNNDGTTVSSPLRDDVELFRRMIIAVDDDDDDVDIEKHYHYDCSSPSTKRYKTSLDGIFRPSSSSSSLLSPPLLLPKSASFYHEISELSDNELSLLALPTLPQSTTTTTTPTIALLPRSSLSPHCFNTLPFYSNELSRSSLYSNNRKEDRMDFTSTRDSNNKQEDSSIHRRSRHEILFPSLRKNHHHNLRYKLSIDVSPTSTTESEHLYSSQSTPTTPVAT
jgi:hypothetical protein